MMRKTTDVLLMVRGLGKIYDSCLDKPRKEYSLTQIEIKIISFLYNNPDKDTAADISYIRMLPKGNVSQAITSLMKKGYILKHDDEVDHRKSHLYLTPASKPIVAKIKKAYKEFLKKVFQDMEEDEVSTFVKLNHKIYANIVKEMETKND